MIPVGGLALGQPVGLMVISEQRLERGICVELGAAARAPVRVSAPLG